MLKNVFKGSTNDRVHLCTNFKRLIEGVAAQSFITETTLSDVTPYECDQITASYLDGLVTNHSRPSHLYQLVALFFLAPSVLVYKYRLGREAIHTLMKQIELSFARGQVAPGEAVGVIAAQSL